uniref:Uncharacterized protein n=2 Tax=Biomphalaria glabrata TaxID=6526 RepID=A0A2C9M6N5_BIOGL
MIIAVNSSDMSPVNLDLDAVNVSELKTNNQIDEINSKISHPRIKETLTDLQKLICDLDQDAKKCLLKSLITIGESAKEDLITMGKAVKEDVHLYDKTCVCDAKKVFRPVEFPKKNNFKISLKSLKQDQSEDEFKALLTSCSDALERLEEHLKELNERYAHYAKTRENEILTLYNSSYEMEVDIWSANNDLEVKLQEQCQSLTKASTDLLKNCLPNMMSKWRRYESLAHVGHIPSHDREVYIEKLDKLFTRVFQLALIQPTEVESSVVAEKLASVSSTIENFNTHLSALKSAIIEIAWYFEVQPSPCIKVNTSKNSEDIILKLRPLGIALNEIKSQEIVYFAEKNSKKHVKCQIKKIKEAGNTITVTVQLSNFERHTKRSANADFDHFNRIQWELQLKGSNAPTIKCLSLPFTVRSGSTQLWYYIGAVHWYCWVQTDLYQPRFHCSTTMPLEVFISMLQERFYTITSQHFTEENVQFFQSLLRQAFPNMKDDVQMKDILQEKMHNTRNNSSHRNNFSTYTWFIAACYTLAMFQEDLKLGVLSSFLSYDQCEGMLMNQPAGSTIVRISRNTVKNEQSERPLASITAHIATGHKQTTAPHVEDPVNIDNLYTFLSHLKVAVNHQTVSVLCLLPSGLTMDKYKSYSKVKQQNGEDNPNGYGKKAFVTPGDIIILGDEMQPLSQMLEEKVSLNQVNPESEDVQPCTKSIKLDNKQNSKMDQIPSMNSPQSFQPAIQSSTSQPNFAQSLSLLPLENNSNRIYLDTNEGPDLPLNADFIEMWARQQLTNESPDLASQLGSLNVNNNMLSSQQQCQENPNSSQDYVNVPTLLSPTTANSSLFTENSLETLDNDPFNILDDQTEDLTDLFFPAVRT